MKRRLARIIALASIAGLMVLVVSVQVWGQIFFINRTSSMPVGVYLKSNRFDLHTGDIIVFKLSDKTYDLIKYVAAVGGDEFCFGEDGSLWVNGHFVAVKNIQKYGIDLSEESSCQLLASDELLVIGEHPNSYDSRYFGPIKVSHVIAAVGLFYQF